MEASLAIRGAVLMISCEAAMAFMTGCTFTALLKTLLLGDVAGGSCSVAGGVVEVVGEELMFSMSLSGFLR